MVLYYLDSYQGFGKAPREIVDPNIYSDYSKLEQLLKITENLDVKDSEKEDHRVNVKRILDGEHPNVVITTQFTLMKSFNDQDFFSLLFYLGYLTIDHVEEFELTMKIPNMVMKKVFINYFQSMLEKELDFQVDIKGWQSAIAAFITKNDATLYIQEIEHTLHRYSDRVLIDFKEKNVQQIGEMIVSGVTGVDSDLEDENDDGYSDHVIIPINSKHHRKLIEYKYLKVNYTQAQLQKAIKEAEEQIVKYKAARQIQRYEYDSWIMIFSKDKCVYSQAIG